MIEKYNSTHARKHRKALQAHMKKTVPNEDEFTQRFATERVRPFFGFGAIAACGPKTGKKRVRIHFMKTWYGRFTRQLFYGSGPIFFYSVNGA